MRKVGLRALKWPLKRTEVEGVTQKLERYKSSFLLSLQVDQTPLMAGVAQNTDYIDQNMDLGKLEGAIEAGFKSFSDRDEVKCLQGTRTELLQQVMEWAMSPSQKSIFWLKGMAGTGKSIICQTVASRVAFGADWRGCRAPSIHANPRRMQLYTGLVLSAAFSPDGQLLASASGDETVWLWDTATGAQQQVLEGHTDWVQSAAFSPNGRLLASASRDKTVRLWDTATGTLQQLLGGHTDLVWSVVFSPDSQLLASASRDKTVRLWDTATGALQETLSTERMVTELEFSRWFTSQH